MVALTEHAPLIEDIRLLKMAEARQGAFAMLLSEMTATVLRQPALLEEARAMLGEVEQARVEIARQLERLNHGLPVHGHGVIEWAAVQNIAEAAREEDEIHRHLSMRVHDVRAAEVLHRISVERGAQAAVMEGLRGKPLPRYAGDASLAPWPERSVLHDPPRRGA